MFGCVFTSNWMVRVHLGRVPNLDNSFEDNNIGICVSRWNLISSLLHYNEALVVIRALAAVVQC